jgi:hypothetical protein
MMQGAQVAYPARIVFRLVLELEQLDPHLGVIAGELFGLLPPVCVVNCTRPFNGLRAGSTQAAPR